MALEKFRAFMDVGRVQGVPVTAAIAILGGLTASPGPDLLDIIWLVIISIPAHMGGAALNELWDRRLDSAVKELANKPLVSGALSPFEAKLLIAICAPLSLGMAFIVFGTVALLAMSMATVWMYWYCTSGKRTFIVSDLAQCVGFGSFALFGALAVGIPTSLTWPLVGIVATLNLFAQWGNGLKDADNDRRFGIPSFAARTGVTARQGLSASHPYFIYGVGIKVAFLSFCTLPIFLAPVPMSYLFIVLALGCPVQYMTMRNFIGIKSRHRYVRLILGDLLLSYPAAAAISIMSAGLSGFLLLALFVFGGYLVASALQSGAEFKFGADAPKRQPVILAKRHGRLYIKGNPIMMSWMAKVAGR